jgi:hypothetical protein
MTAVGLVGGDIVSEVLETKGFHIEMELHLVVGIIIIALFIIAGSLGFIMLRDPSKIVAIRPIHKWVNLTSLVLFLFQGMYGYFYLFTL